MNILVIYHMDDGEDLKTSRSHDKHMVFEVEANDLGLFLNEAKRNLPHKNGFTATIKKIYAVQEIE
jgi:hypothetical protein